ncbi:hypothetical protein SAPIO_CDS10154 [Scedosporium apiospermum]|uniref:Heterokaryon incompatibility domain-containing protein n=1 Tax=Pseudallescheria apiosperma TaxID=563466 RepID=A0A084FWH4_PSEDA|nr:uncharacterized protein SAPIO_CDS10154 [Scedosporium apiospermum]KEZ39436.1 hypothetical protein SAPIO_CDS10154 [Scedosporium apiospermum]
MHSYNYSPLTDADSIRVMVLYPLQLEGTYERLIYCDLVQTRLSDVTSDENAYTAISYVWGEKRYSNLICVLSEESYLYIGSNLYSLLKNLRQADEVLCLWVDAICINQDDITERNRQVHQMCDIFSSARETIVYLGDADGGNTGLSAWNFLESRSTWALNDYGHIDFDRPATMREALDFKGDISDVEIDVLPRPWFRRVKRYDDGGTYIVNSLQRARRLEASDPRDKAFALLGISTGFDKGHPDTSANYEKTTKRVYADLAAYILQTTDSYDLSSYLDNGSESIQGQRVFDASILDLPSWVPNWNRSEWGTGHISRSLFGTLELELEA